MKKPFEHLELSLKGSYRLLKILIKYSMRNWTVSFIICMLLIAFESIAQERRELGNMVMEGIPETPQEIKDRILQYQNTRSAAFQDWLPNDQGMLISTRFANTYQFHTVKMPGGARNQITFYDEPVMNGSFCPSDEYNGFIFEKDIGGNEFYQLYWFDMDNMTAEMISDSASINGDLVWSNNGSHFAFTSTRRNNVDFDIYISVMSSPKEAELIIDQGDGWWFAADWSPDDEKLVVVQYISVNKVNSYIYDLNKNELTQINDNSKEAVFAALGWDSTGEKIYAITDEEGEFTTLVLYDTKSRTYESITSDILWDVEWLRLNKQRTRAAFTVNENGYSQLYLLDTKNNQYNKIPNLPIGQVTYFKFHPTKDELAIMLNTSETPGDVFTIDLKSFSLERWTESEVGGLNTSSFPKPELIAYETFDEVDGVKRKIPAFVYKPVSSDKPVPVLVLIHGGPESQFIPSFSSLIAYFVNELEIAVIAPNVRGSSGYGKSYLKLDNGYNRENTVKDIGKLLEWIEANPELDKNRIAVYGGSYGGYMVLSSMVSFNEKLACGIDVVGISNFVTFLENTEEYRRDLRRVEYGDERDPKMREFLNSISPNTNVNKITKPILIAQGANDPRVPASESEQMVKAIRNNNGLVWYMLAKDEGHGYQKKENNDMLREAIALFLLENLLKE